MVNKISLVYSNMAHMEILENNQENKDNSIIEAMNKFYQMKSKYETLYSQAKQEIKKKSMLSWKEKRYEFKKFVPKCINCDRPVGSIFENKVNDKFDRILKAMCGDRKDPCPLDIEINLGTTYDLRDLMNENEREIKKYKDQIIMDKNDFLFGYIQSEQAVKKFDEIKDEIKESIESSEFYLLLLNEKTGNEEKRNHLKKIQEELYTNISNIKKYIHEYNQTQNKQFINDAVQIYVEEMIPRLKEIMRDTYANTYVDHEENMNILIQQHVLLKDVEYTLGDKVGVLKMKLGMPSSKKDKSRKSRSNPRKNVSRKNVVIRQESP
jgi:hypothetical protein